MKNKSRAGDQAPRMKMKGLMMCQSLSATAVKCSTGRDHHDPSSVMVATRPSSLLVPAGRPVPGLTMNPGHYHRLIQTQSPPAAPHHYHHHRRIIQSPPPPPAAPHHYNPLIQPRPPAPHDDHHHHEEEEGRVVTTSSSSLVSPTHDHRFQVVVMRVSIHCQGCAGKVKKHLSRMEGVTSFSIDLESKRVTVTGHVSAAGVVESISKVKKAELWPAP